MKNCSAAKTLNKGKQQKQSNPNKGEQPRDKKLKEVNNLAKQ